MADDKKKNNFGRGVVAGATAAGGTLAGGAIGRKIAFNRAMKTTPLIEGHTSEFVRRVSNAAHKGKLLGMAGGALAAGAVAGRILKPKQEKKAEENIYLQKIASQLGMGKEAAIGTLGKSIIRSKLAPALSNLSKGKLSNLEVRSRSAMGSKLYGNVTSQTEKLKQSASAKSFFQKKTPSIKPTDTEANRLVAVAARAKRMGVV